jgi:hypothetical protein
MEMNAVVQRDTVLRLNAAPSTRLAIKAVGKQLEAGNAVKTAILRGGLYWELVHIGWFAPFFPSLFGRTFSFAATARAFPSDS